MGQISKGKITIISGNKARVAPSDASAKPTAYITIPWHLRGSTGNLKKGTEVVYVEFDDATGLLLGRADGEWGAYLPNIAADDFVAGDVSLKDHVHSGVASGSGSTSTPKPTESSGGGGGSGGTSLTSFKAGSHKLTHHSEETGDSVSYWLHVPENATTNMPVIVFLHGSGERYNIDAIKNYGLINQAKKIYGDSFPFIAVYPSLKYGTWYSFKFPETIKSLIEYVVTACSANPKKVIITGHSLGAMGTWDIVSRYGTFFSCAVPVSYNISGGVTDYANLAKIPIWAFSGDGAVDFVFEKPMRDNVNTINKHGGNAEYSLLTNCDHAQAKDEAYSIETFEWMLAQ